MLGETHLAEAFAFAHSGGRILSGRRVLRARNEWGGRVYVPLPGHGMVGVGLEYHVPTVYGNWRVGFIDEPIRVIVFALEKLPDSINVWEDGYES